MIEAVEAPSEPGLRRRGRNNHVIIAEDNAVTRRMIELAVLRVGWTFDSASNGLQALSLVERWILRVGLVLADIEMPRMSGIELVTTMKSIPTLAHVPVILMGSADLEPQARAARCDGFLAKPFSTASLLDALSA